ncbi:hypothetical protein ACLNGM_05085 [Aureimonas phyllosphaerae]|uniref:hypothetical protein n=1 Tax=Aureimonas phyllosphaerae TaxID=1166078 RepID=UPI003A5C2610
MIRVAALLCMCSVVLAACYGGGSRAAIVRSSMPVAVCLDGRDADTPSWRRICPGPTAARAAVSHRVGGTRLRRSAELAPWDLRRPDSSGEAARQVYLRRFVLRRASSEPLSPQDAAGAIDASLLMVPASGPAPLAQPYLQLGLALRGSLD